VDTISNVIDQNRRHFLGAASLTVAAAQLGILGSAAAQTDNQDAVRRPVVRPETNASFGPIKQIDAGVLSIGYAEAGPADGWPVILLHGWPYDIHT
jgi:hypothetical protein